MSIYFEFDVGPKGRRFRRAVNQDKIDIETFWCPEETDTLFCNSDFGSLIELSTLAICMIDAEMNVTGFMALSDHPALPGLEPSTWEHWMRNMFQKYYTARNTLFIHFMCCINNVADFFLEEALISVFMNDFYLQHIILVVPPTCKIDCMAKYPAFKRRTIYRKCTKYEDVESCYVLFVAMRKDFVPKLKVRRAVEEDNDDIVRLLDKKCKTLKEIYGDYYISEILSRHPESQRTIIVAEHKDKLVGVMCLNPAVNYAKLQNIYELGPYNGLVTPDSQRREDIKRSNALLQTFGEPIMKGNWSPFEFQKKTSVHSSFKELTPRQQQKPTPLCKVNFSPKRLRRTSINVEMSTANVHYKMSQESERTVSPCMSLATDISLMFLLDDEPLDYEIVNIDRNLFTVPEVPSFDDATRSRLEHSNNSLLYTTSHSRIRHKKRMGSSIDSMGALFEGSPNAFIIELFGIQEGFDGRHAYDLLEAAFDCMPHYEYCIIRVPTKVKAFTLLHHFCFVPTKPNICCRYALYIAHRNSVGGRLRVRQAEIADLPQISMFLHNVDGKETIYTIEQAIHTSRRHQIYVFLSGYNIIGVGILDPPEHTYLVRAKFLLENYQHLKYHIAGQGLDGGFAMLKTVLVYPTFEPHFAFFAREMLRHSGSTALLWLTAYRNKWVAHKANGIVSSMVPLPFRTSTETGLLPELKQIYNLSKNLLSFSAWFISKKFTSIPKLNVDTRIVVVGASRTAIAFIYHLLFGDTAPYLTFTNITLVSINGLPYLRHPMPAAERMFPKFQTTCDRFMKSTPFTYYVNIVHATMFDIVKSDKCVITDAGNRIYYDKLFLFMGKQHQHPGYLRALTKKQRDIRSGKMPLYVRMDDPLFIETQREPPTDLDTPENVFIVNNVNDANRALTYIRSFFWRYENYKICVYGTSIDAYCCITALLELEILPNDIAFIEPFPPEDETKPRAPLFCNQKVDHTVLSFMKNLGINIYSGYYFKGWTLDEQNIVQSVEFISHYRMVKIHCAAFFFYGKRYINPNAFVAISKSGIAYDGGILIDHNFQTNDPSIYAAGPAARYYRRYNADDRLQKFFDSYEIGKTLGLQIRNELDPLLLVSDNEKPNLPVHIVYDSSSNTTSYGSTSSSDNVEVDNKESKGSNLSYGHTIIDYRNLIPKFNRPLVWYCVLPGGLQYLEVRPPGPKFPHYYIQSMDYNGYVMETYKSGYFKIHLNKEFILDGVTCLTPEKRSIEMFKALYGHSAVVLNNVHLRFNAGKIQDFYDYFRMPWSVFLYDEGSKELLKVVEYLKPKDNPNGKTLEEILRGVGERMLSTAGGESLKQKVNFEKNIEAIMDYVMEWLSDNDLFMPMYFKPGGMMEFSHDVSRNPAFKRCKKNIKKMLAMIA